MDPPRLVPRAKIAPPLLAGYEHLLPTVDHSAASRSGEGMPAGFDHSQVSIGLPKGSFERAAEALLTMAVHREARLLTAMPAPTLAEGDTVASGVPLGPLALVVPCRVVWVSSVGLERGFGYSTLPGHPEAGEESFIVREASDGAVTFTVRAFSRPAGLTRLAGPVVQLAAHMTIKRYLAAMTRIVEAT